MPKSPVPKLDLAPKLNRPLQLWNPLDYFRLLYWIFNFPQAIPYHLEKYNHRQNLLFQLIFLSSILCILSIQICTFITSDIRLSELFLSLAICSLIAWGYSFKKINSLKEQYSLETFLVNVGNISFWSTILCLLYVFILGEESVFFGLKTLLFWVFISVSALISEDTFYTLHSKNFSRRNRPIYERSFREIFVSILSIFITYIVFLNINSWAIHLRNNQVNEFWLAFNKIVSYVTVYISFFFFHASFFRGIVVLRLDLIFLSIILRRKLFFLALWHAGYLTFDNLKEKTKRHFQQDFEMGISNCNEILRFSKQYMSVVDAIILFLCEVQANKILVYSHFLIDGILDKDFILFVPQFISNKKSKTDVENTISKVFLGYESIRKKEFTLAAKHFVFLRSKNIDFAEEVYLLSQCLQELYQIKEISEIVDIRIKKTTADLKLHGSTWNAIEKFEYVILDTQLLINSVSRQTQSLALNRIIGQLFEVIQSCDDLPFSEQALVFDIATSWKVAFEAIASEIGSTEITQPVENPYVIGDPVFGQNFAGRDDIMRQLEELWITNKICQSIVLYGHRRMGKTSILRNATSHIGSTGKVIYINLQRLGEVEEGVGEVLISLSDEISIATNIEPPSDDDLLKLPKRNFERYLKKVLAEMESDRLIIALDEFETLEDLIARKQISKEFLGYLRGLVQMSPELAFAFAGLHTLEEMTADYFQPFFASVIPIRVSFLNREATFQLLVSPTEDFPLDYDPAALQKIYDYTNGQPYLVQLIGFQLVRRYNDYVFEQGRQRDNLLTTEDVEAIITEDFFRKGRYYFDGVWRQASQDAAGQQDIIKTLATYPAGLTTAELLELIPFDADILEDALEMLTKHDVIHDISELDAEPRWQITVELLRIWLEKYAPPLT